MNYKLDNLLEKVESLHKDYLEYERLLCSVEICQDNKLLKYYQDKKKEIEPIFLLYNKYLNNVSDIEIVSSLAEAEKDFNEKNKLLTNIQNLKTENEQLLNEIQNLFVSFGDKVNQESRVEILSKNDKEDLELIFEILNKYSELSHFEIKTLEEKDKSKILLIGGENSFESLGCLSGIYKIVKNGHESQVQVLVLKEDAKNQNFDEKDVEMEISKSGGAGGQHINKTESAVKLIHVPTGITASCQDERSQLKNKERALENLKQKVVKAQAEKNAENIKLQRKKLNNLIFSGTATFVIDFDKNKFISNKTKIDYKIDEILSGNLRSVINDFKL